MPSSVLWVKTKARGNLLLLGNKFIGGLEALDNMDGYFKVLILGYLVYHKVREHLIHMRCMIQTRIVASSGEQTSVP